MPFTNGGYYALESTHVCNTPFRLIERLALQGRVRGPRPAGVLYRLTSLAQLWARAMPSVLYTVTRGRMVGRAGTPVLTTRRQAY
jgi:hypothetical protein